MKSYFAFTTLLALSLLIILLVIAGDYYLEAKNNAGIKILIPSLITSCGIFLSGMLAIWQQGKLDDRATKIRERKSYAARSAMPSALDEMCDYARNCTKDLLVIYQTSSTVRQPPISQDSSIEDLFRCEFPYEAVKVLRECIEHADDTDRTQIAKCLRCLQIHRARINDFKNKFTDDFDSVYRKNLIEKMIFDTCKLYRTCSKLFPYARMTKKSPHDFMASEEQLLWGDLHSIGIDEASHPELYDKVQNVLLSEDNQF
jgi:hypothetical protein